MKIDRNIDQIFLQEKDNKFSTPTINTTKKKYLSFNVKEVKSNQKAISILEKYMYSSLAIPVFENC